MINPIYERYLGQTSEPIAAALLTLAEVIAEKPESVVLTVKQAAKKLGVSTRTVYDLCTTGKLRHQQLGRLIRIKPEDLDDVKATKGGEIKLRRLGL